MSKKNTLHPRRKLPSRLRTYSHLTGEHRIPSDYEIVTSKLLYYPPRGFEVATPTDAWYATWQRGAKLAANDWDRFVDPRATTYALYAQIAHTRETYVDGVLRAVDDAGSDARLSPKQLAFLQRFFTPLRYPYHGLHMIAAYVAQMAPSGRIAVASLFQCGDEMRRIERIAYRMVQIAQAFPGFGGESRATWESDRAWQPMRELIKRLLVTWDWTEALFVLNVIVKPALESVTMQELARVSREQFADATLEALVFSFREDNEWHSAWARAALRIALENESTDSRKTFDAWREKWAPLAIQAASAYVGAFSDASKNDVAARAVDSTFEHLVQA